MWQGFLDRLGTPCMRYGNTCSPKLTNARYLLLDRKNIPLTYRLGIIYITTKTML